MRRRSILLIDDDERFSACLFKTFTDCGYHVDRAEDATSAKRLLAQYTFDLAIVDLNLPDENGIELIRQLAARKRRPKVIATTATMSDLFLDIAAYVGADLATRKFSEVPQEHAFAAQWRSAVETVLNR